jgi:predicted nucleic acid-binding protein
MSGERFTLDTNILVYSIDARDARKQARALAILKASVRLDCPLALQAIGEFHVAATRKLKLPAVAARERSLQLLKSFDTFAHSASVIRTALDASSERHFSFWDTALLASAAESGCSVLLSEDMRDGARLGSIVVRNPFGTSGLSESARDLLG